MKTNESVNTALALSDAAVELEAITATLSSIETALECGGTEIESNALLIPCRILRNISRQINSFAEIILDEERSEAV